MGDRIRCLPGNQLFRVRSLQVHGDPTVSATWGQRVALNVASQDAPESNEGHVLCDERLTQVSDRFDASLEVRPSAGAGVKNHQRVRVHSEQPNGWERSFSWAVRSFCHPARLGSARSHCPSRSW